MLPTQRLCWQHLEEISGTSHRKGERKGNGRGGEEGERAGKFKTLKEFHPLRSFLFSERVAWEWVDLGGMPKVTDGGCILCRLLCFHFLSQLLMQSILTDTTSGKLKLLGTLTNMWKCKGDRELGVSNTGGRTVIPA